MRVDPNTHDCRRTRASQRQINSWLLLLPWKQSCIVTGSRQQRMEVGRGGLLSWGLRRRRRRGKNCYFFREAKRDEQRSCFFVASPVYCHRKREYEHSHICCQHTQMYCKRCTHMGGFWHLHKHVNTPSHTRAHMLDTHTQMQGWNFWADAINTWSSYHKWVNTIQRRGKEGTELQRFLLSSTWSLSFIFTNDILFIRDGCSPFMERNKGTEISFEFFAAE